MDVLAYDKAGAVAVLLVVLIALSRVSYTLLMRMLNDKDAQITKLLEANERLSDEIGKTLAAVLAAIKEQADERRRQP